MVMVSLATTSVATVVGVSVVAAVVAVAAAAFAAAISSSVRHGMVGRSGDVGYGARSGVRVATRRAQGDGQGCGHTGTLLHNIITMITAIMMLRAIHEVW